MDVLVIVLCGTVHIGLARAAVRQGWTVLAVGTAVEAMREIRDRSPRLVVVQVTLLSNEPVKLIRFLHHSSQPVLIVAVAGTHRNQLERLVRDAGANCYLPSTDEDESIVQAVTSMLESVPAGHAHKGSAGFADHFEPPRLVRQGDKGLRH